MAMLGAPLARITRASIEQPTPKYQFPDREYTKFSVYPYTLVDNHLLQASKPAGWAGRARTPSDGWAPKSAAATLVEDQERGRTSVPTDNVRHPPDNAGA